MSNIYQQYLSKMTISRIDKQISLSNFSEAFENICEVKAAFSVLIYINGSLTQHLTGSLHPIHTTKLMFIIRCSQDVIHRDILKVFDKLDFNIFTKNKSIRSCSSQQGLGFFNLFRCPFSQGLPTSRLPCGQYN